MTEKELRKRLRELVTDECTMAGNDWAQGRHEVAYWRRVNAMRIVKLLTDYDEQQEQADNFLSLQPAAADALRKVKEAASLKERHPEVAKWYEKHGLKPAEIPVASSDGVHTCYEGCTHPAHEGAPVPPIGTEPLADPDDAHTERATVEQMVEKALAPIAEEHRASLDSGPVNEVWSHYVSAHPDHKTCRLTAPRKRMIQARLKEGYTVEQLKDAITGFHLSPFHTGENEQKKRYLEFELMVRSGEQVEKGLGCLRDARQPGKATGPSEAQIAAQQAEIRATVDAALAKPIPAPEAPPAPEKKEVEFL